MALTKVNTAMVSSGRGDVASNTALGASSLNSNTTGANNVAVGQQALNGNTTAPNNTAVGYQAMYSNTTGDTNVAVGYRAIYTNTIGTNNVGVGKDALYSLGSGVNNTAIGDQAGRACTGNVSTFVGASAGIVATGSSNTFIGCSAGEAITSGAKNTVLGRYNGNQGGLDIRTASNWVVLSDGDGNWVFRASQSGTTVIAPLISSSNNVYGFDTSEFYPNPDNTLKLGLSNFRWTTVYATTGTINTSDATQKQQIRDLNTAEKAVAIRIKSLIKCFKFNDAVETKGDGARIHVGVIAQEVQAAFEAEGLDPAKYAMFCSDTWYEVDGKPSEPEHPYTADTPNAVEVTRLGVRYEQLLAFVIAAM